MSIGRTYKAGTTVAVTYDWIDKDGKGWIDVPALDGTGNRKLQWGGEQRVTRTKTIHGKIVGYTGTDRDTILIRQRNDMVASVPVVDIVKVDVL